MKSRRSVLVGVPSGARHGPLLAAGLEMARLFGVPVRCLFVEEETVLDVDARTLVRPRGGAAPRGGAHAGAMRAALEIRSRGVRAELERLGGAASVQVSFAIARGVYPEGLGASAEPGDLLVLPADLTERRLEPLVARAARLGRQTGAALLLPEARPRRTGPVAALARAGDRAVREVAADLARRLSAPLETAEPSPAGRPAADGGRAVPGVPARLVVAAADPDDPALLSALAGALRTGRSGLLLIHGG